MTIISTDMNRYSQPSAVGLPDEALLATSVTQTSVQTSIPKETGMLFLKNPWLKYAFLVSGGVGHVANTALARLSTIAARTGVTAAVETVAEPVAAGVGVAISGALTLVGMLFATGDSGTPRTHSADENVSSDPRFARAMAAAVPSSSSGDAAPAVDLATPVTLGDLEGGEFMRAGGDARESDARRFVLTELSHLLPDLQGQDAGRKAEAAKELLNYFTPPQIRQLIQEIDAATKAKVQANEINATIKLPRLIAEWLMSLGLSGGDPAQFSRLPPHISAALDAALSIPRLQEEVKRKLTAASDTPYYTTWLPALLEEVLKSDPRRGAWVQSVVEHIIRWRKDAFASAARYHTDYSQLSQKDVDGLQGRADMFNRLAFLLTQYGHPLSAEPSYWLDEVKHRMWAIKRARPDLFSNHPPKPAR